MAEWSFYLLFETGTGSKVLGLCFSRFVIIPFQPQFPHPLKFPLS